MAAAISAPPARAVSQCATYGAEDRWVCVSVHNGQTWGFFFIPITPQPTSPYIWVEECDSAGQNCAVLYASITSGIGTPAVPATAGKTYRACADFFDTLNNQVYGCSPAEAA